MTPDIMDQVLRGLAAWFLINGILLVGAILWADFKAARRQRGR